MVDGRQQFSNLTIFLREKLRIPEHDELFLFCDSSFRPDPETSLHELLQVERIRRCSFMKNVGTVFRELQ